jgi:hypothetical protein
LTDISTVLYESAEPLVPGERFMAGLVQLVDERGANRKLTGNKVKVHLPMAFYAETADGAINRALAFWHDEKTKAEAKSERMRQLHKSKAA